MVYKPAYMEVSPFAIDPKNVYAGLDLSGVCPWVEKFRGDRRYSGRSDSSSQASVSSSSKLELTLDEEAADDGQTKAQNQWVTYFNQRNKRMVSMPDLYLAGKSNNPKLLDSLRKDFGRSWVVTSTRILYGDELNAKIIHNYGSTLIQPVEHKVVIPEYQPQSLAAVLDTYEGFKFLQVLFETNDSAPQIKDALQKLSNHSSDKIRVWSAGRSARPIERAVGFEIVGSLFHVVGSIIDYVPGCSRGVCLTR